MNFGFSGEAFSNLLVLLAFIAITIIGVIFYIAHKRGIDVTQRAFQLRVGITGAVIFVIVPLWLSDLTIEWKIISSVLALAAGIGNYFTIDRMQRALKEKLGDKKKRE